MNKIIINYSQVFLLFITVSLVCSHPNIKMTVINITNSHPSLQIHLVLTEFTAEDCKVIGFNKANLLCSTCEKFKDFELSEP